MLYLHVIEKEAKSYVLPKQLLTTSILSFIVQLCAEMSCDDVVMMLRSVYHMAFCLVHTIYIYCYWNHVLLQMSRLMTQLQKALSDLWEGPVH